VPRDHQSELLYGNDGDAVTPDDWYDWLRNLPRDERLGVQQSLGECDDLFDRIYAVLKKSAENGESGGRSFIRARPPRMLAESERYLDECFSSSFKYLGPLRDAPKPLYPLAPAADPRDVGIRGEHTASVLELQKHERVRYISPSSFRATDVEKKTTVRTLQTAVVDWLKYLGVADSVQSRDQGKLGHELKVALSDSDATHDLTHVGVGVSQVLPILVTCLLADRDSTLVF